MLPLPPILLQELQEDLDKVVSHFISENAETEEPQQPQLCTSNTIAPKYVRYDARKHVYYYLNQFHRPTYLKPEQVRAALSGTMPGHVGGEVRIGRAQPEYADYRAHLPAGAAALLPAPINRRRRRP